MNLAMVMKMVMVVVFLSMLLWQSTIGQLSGRPMYSSYVGTTF